jgi:hypothetical protein
VAIVVPTPNTTITSAWGKSVADAINALQLPRELAYAQITAGKTIANTTETAADLVVAAPAVTFDGTTAVLVEVFSPAVVPAAVAGSGLVHIWLYQDGASIGRLALVTNPAGSSMYVPVHATRRLTPAAGSHTFSFAATQGGGNGTVAAGPGGVGNYMPAYIRITRIA